MSMLLRAEPIGIGTHEIESISSYFIRLSVVNGASPRKLLEWICKRNKILEVLPSIASSSPITLVRPTKLNTNFLYALSQSTGLDVGVLNRMTYHSLNNVVNRHNGSYDKRVRWCPACVCESASSGDPTHFRLNWALTGFITCPIHRFPLQNKCPVCGAFQDSWREREAIDLCISCHTSLGYSFLHPEYGTAACIPSRDEPEAPDLILLTKFISEGNGYTFVKDGPRKALKEAFECAWDRNEEHEYYKTIPRDECLAYLSCNKPFTLTTARRISYRTGIPLVDLLCGSSRQNTRELDVNWRYELPSSLKPNMRAPRLNVDRVKSQIKQALKDPKKPSLKELSLQIGVSTGGLYYHAYHLCMLISKRHKQRLAEEKQQKHKDAAKAIRASIKQWNSERFDPPNKKGLLKLLYPSTGLPKDILREEISKALISNKDIKYSP